MECIYDSRAGTCTVEGCPHVGRNWIARAKALDNIYDRLRSRQPLLCIEAGLINNCSKEKLCLAIGGCSKSPAKQDILQAARHLVAMESRRYEHVPVLATRAVAVARAYLDIYERHSEEKR